METIEEAARKNCEFNEFSLRQFDKHFIECFKDGVEFAQRWIPVEEELPKEMVCVLLKSEYEGHISFDVGFLMDGKFKTKNSKPTHWRLIELK